MSPRRPVTGVVTAAASSVAVSSHDALAEEVPSSSGSRGISGIMTVCMRETTTPALDSVTITVMAPAYRGLFTAAR
jgi:hypothetical protein